MHTSGTCWLALAASWASSQLQSKRAQEAQGLWRRSLRSFTVPFHPTPAVGQGQLRGQAWSQAAKQAFDGKTYRSQNRHLGRHFSVTVHCIPSPLKPISGFDVRKRLQMWWSFGKWLPSTPNTNIDYHSLTLVSTTYLACAKHFTWLGVLFLILTSSNRKHQNFKGGRNQ